MRPVHTVRKIKDREKYAKMTLRTFQMKGIAGILRAKYLTEVSQIVLENTTNNLLISKLQSHPILPKEISIIRRRCPKINIKTNSFTMVYAIVFDYLRRHRMNHTLETVQYEFNNYFNDSNFQKFLKSKNFKLPLEDTLDVKKYYLTKPLAKFLNLYRGFPRVHIDTEPLDPKLMTIFDKTLYRKVTSDDPSSDLPDRNYFPLE